MQRHGLHYVQYSIHFSDLIMDQDETPTFFLFLVNLLMFKLSLTITGRKTNLHKFCLAQMNFTKLCIQCSCGDGRICSFLCKYGHRHHAKLFEFHICNIFVPFWSKFDFSSRNLKNFFFSFGSRLLKKRTKKINCWQTSSFRKLRQDANYVYYFLQIERPVD